MGMGLEKAYATLKNSPPMTDKVVNNPASPYQGVATLAQQFQAQANQTPTPIPMQSALQQQQAQQQPTTFAKGKTVSAKSPDHAIEQNIQKLFGANVPPKLKALLKKGTANFLSTGKPNPKYLREVLAEVAKLPQEVQAKYAPKIAEIKAILAKSSKGVAALAKGGDVRMPEGWAEDVIETRPSRGVEDIEAVADSGKGVDDIKETADYLASLYKSDGVSPKMLQAMESMQEGRKGQGLASVIGAALTGAATPHALQSGQASAMMAGEAADKGVASLNAGQDMMMAKAAEMEGAPTKNYNAALGSVWNSLQEDKKYRNTLAATQARGDNSYRVAELKGQQGTDMEIAKQKNRIATEAFKHEHRAELQDASLRVKTQLAELADATRRELDTNRTTRSNNWNMKERSKDAMEQANTAFDAYKNNVHKLGDLDSFPVHEVYLYFLDPTANPRPAVLGE